MKEKKYFNRLLTLIYPYRWRLVLAVIFMGLAAAATAGVAWITKPLLDKVFIDKNVKLLNYIPFAALGIFVAKGVFTFCQAYLMNYIGYTVVNNLRVELYSRMQTLSLNFFHRNATGKLISNVVNDVGLIQSSVTTVVTGLVLDSLTVVGLIAVLVYLDIRLAAIGLLVLPAAMYPIMNFGRKLRRLATDGQNIMGSLISVLTETFIGVRVIQAYNMTDYEIKRFAEECRKSVDNLMKAVTIKSFSSPLMESLGGLCVAFIIWYGGYEVIKGRSTPGSFISFMTALLLLYEPLKRLARLNNEIQQGLSAAKRIFDIIDIEPSIVDGQAGKILTAVKGELEFKNVVLSYDNKNNVLDGVSFKINPGEMVAIVGHSGAGKTSLANLVPRFYDPSSGEILIDGQNIKDLKLSNLREQLALVSQDIVLFNESVKHNIAYGRPSASMEEIENAAKAAVADKFIKELPHSYEEMIGESGCRLSGGQRQRLAIARAILKNAPILILDEATSALDTESEKAVQEALENLTRKKTTMVIAHRLSTIQKASRIIVLKDGHIVESGDHEQLMKNKGEYYKLYNMQFSSNVSEAV